MNGFFSVVREALENDYKYVRTIPPYTPITHQNLFIHKHHLKIHIMSEKQQGIDTSQIEKLVEHLTTPQALRPQYDHFADQYADRLIKHIWIRQNRNLLSNKLWLIMHDIMPTEDEDVYQVYRLRIPLVGTGATYMPDVSELHVSVHATRKRLITKKHKYEFKNLFFPQMYYHKAIKHAIPGLLHWRILFSKYISESDRVQTLTQLKHEFIAKMVGFDRGRVDYHLSTSP